MLRPILPSGAVKENGRRFKLIKDKDQHANKENEKANGDLIGDLTNKDDDDDRLTDEEDDKDDDDRLTKEEDDTDKRSYQQKG